MTKCFAVQSLICLPLAALVACGPANNDNNDNNVNRPNPGTCQLLESADVEEGGDLDGCFLVESRLEVASGVLKIAPGSVFYFSTNAGLAILQDAAIDAAGEADDQILFTSEEEERGGWRGIAVSSASAKSTLSHVILEYAGGSKWHGNNDSRGGITTLGAARLDVTDSVVRRNAFAGIHVFDIGAEVSISGTSFEDNELPVYIPADTISDLSDLAFEDNDASYIRVGRDAPGTAPAGTWHRHDVPYHFAQTARLGGLVTIEAGTELEFRQDIGLDVSDEGRLSAIGTEDAPIHFRGTEATQGFWKGVNFYQTQSTSNVLDHVILEDAGSAKWHGGDSRGGIFVQGSGVTVAVKNSTFRRNAVAAIYADHDEAGLTVESSLFEDNELPLWLAPRIVGGLAADNTFVNESYIKLLAGDVSTTQTWEALSIPYRAFNRVTVSGELTVAPGTTVEFAQNAGVEVDGGVLIADASGSDEITFTSADEAIAGFWRGIAFTNSRSTQNKLANASVLYAGSQGWHGGADSRAAIFLQDQSAVALEGVTIDSSGAYGVSAENGTTIDPCDVTITNSAEAPLLGDVATSAC